MAPHTGSFIQICNCKGRKQKNTRNSCENMLIYEIQDMENAKGRMQNSLFSFGQSVTSVGMKNFSMAIMCMLAKCSTTSLLHLSRSW